MNKPNRPEVVRLGLTPGGAQPRRYCYASEADAYITAIEQELDEAVELLRDVDNAYYARDAATSVVGALSRIGEFLARIEGGDNVG